MGLTVMNAPSERRARWGWKRAVGVIVGVFLFLGASPSGGREQSPNVAINTSQEVGTPLAYAPFAFLIGEWDVAVEDGEAAAVSRSRWGPAWRVGSRLSRQ